MGPRVYYEVTPPSRWSTRQELESAVSLALRAGAQGIDITDSPAGESHSSSVAASVYVKLAFGAPVLAHIRTRDVTRMGLMSLVRACAVWGVEDVLFVLGEGQESTGLTPSLAVKLVRGEKTLQDRPLRLGLVVDPRRPTNLERKIEAKPDFIYSAPITSKGEAGLLLSLASKTDSQIYAGILVNSDKNRPIMKRIGVEQSFDGPLDWEVVDTLKAVSRVFVVMSPADLESGLQVLREVVRHVA